jgi:hypothetical protein
MSQTDEAWSEVAEQLRALGTTIKNHYDAQAGHMPEDAVSQEEVKDALKTLGDSLTTAVGAAGVAFRDPEVTKEVKETAASFFGALGATFSEMGAGIAATRTGGDPAGDDDSSGSAATEIDSAPADLSEDEWGE